MVDISSQKDLMNVLHLMKHRNSDSFHNGDGKRILQETNVLLVNGLTSNLIQSITDTITELGKNDKLNMTVTLDALTLKAEIIFFTFYQTQIEDIELEKLLKLINSLSDLVVSHGSSDSSFINRDAITSIYSILVILQLAHVAALQQTTYLLSRNVDYSNYQSIEEIEIGNNLPQIVGSRCKMDEIEWKSEGCQGFSCLAYAILRQPEVDLDKAPPADVEWFLHEACRLRAYSHIRLCMLPVIQAMYLQDSGTALFYIATLSELLENLSKIFCMSHYHQRFTHNENDFPHVFFPPTQEFYQNNLTFYLERMAKQKGIASNSALNYSQISIAVDTLEDVMDLFTAVLDVRPSFAKSFWPMSAAGEVYERFYHPFVLKAVEVSYHHPSLFCSASSFVGSLAGAPLGQTAYVSYLFVKDCKHQQLSWHKFFELIHDVIAHMKPKEENPARSSSMEALYLHRPYAFQMQGILGQDTTPAAPEPKELSSTYEEELVCVLKLLAAVVVDPRVYALLSDEFSVLTDLFSLLSCGVHMEIKGAALRALTSIAQSNKHVVREIWHLVETHGLLAPIPTNVTGTKRTAHQLANPLQSGMRAELEDTEAQCGCYPVTDGFLQLLEALFSHGVPNDLGYGTRRPGLMNYLEYLVDQVLLKAPGRLYNPSGLPTGLAQRWKITARVIQIFNLILQHYTINGAVGGVSPDNTSGDLKELVEDFTESVIKVPIEGTTEPQVFPRPKTLGFVLMALLLGKSTLFDHLVELLQECGNADNLQNSFVEYFICEVDSAIDLVQRLHQQQSCYQAANEGGRGGVHRITPMVMEVRHLTEMKRALHLSDGLFWRERCVSGVVGLLYECSLREKTYLKMLRSSSTQLSVNYTENGRQVVFPVIAYDWSELLSTTPALSHIAQLVPQAVRTCPCLPPLNVLCVRLLEHVALNLSPMRLLSSLQLPQKSTADQLSQLAEGCATAIREGGEIHGVDSLDQSSLSYDVKSLGGVISPGLYSLSPSATLTPPPHVHLALLLSDEGVDPSETALGAEFLLSLKRHDSIRDAVLTLLLTTLTPQSLCLSHCLLGVHSSADASALAKGCLDAVLTIMRAENYPVGTTLLQVHPQQAVDCYELMYRLVSSPVVADVMFKTLSNRSVDFLRYHLNLLTYLMHLSDEELVHCLPPSEHNLTDLPSAGLEEIKTALNSCSAWLLRTLGQFLLSYSQSQQHQTETQTGPLSSGLGKCLRDALDLVYGSCRATSFGLERGSNMLVLVKLLHNGVLSYPSNEVPYYCPESVVKYLESSMVVQQDNLGKGGRGLESNNRFLRNDQPFSSATAVKCVDTAKYVSAVGKRIDSAGGVSEADFREGMHCAVVLARRGTLRSSAAHLLLAWRQTVDMSLLLHSQLYHAGLSGFGPASGGDHSAFDYMVTREVLLPAMALVQEAANSLDAVVLEHLARSFLSLITVGLSARGSAISENPGSSAEDFRELLQSLLQVMVRRDMRGSSTGFSLQLPQRHATTKSAGDISPMFRGVLATALSVAVNYVYSSSKSGEDRSGARRMFSDGDGLASSEQKSSSSHQASDQFNPKGLKLFAVLLDTLEPLLPQLLDDLARGVSKGDSTVWRLSCLSTLSLVLSTLQLPFTLNGDPSLFLLALQVLMNKGHLPSILSLIGDHKTSVVQYGALQVIDKGLFGSKAVDNDTRGEGESNEGLFTSAVSLCEVIVTVPEGAEALFRCEILGRIASLDCFLDPPPLAHELAFAGVGGSVSNDTAAYEMLEQARRESLLHLQNRLLPVLNVLCAMVAAAPRDQAVTMAVGRFVQKNHQLLSLFLQLRYLSMRGLQIIEKVTQLLALLVTTADQISRLRVNPEQQNGPVSALSQLLGSKVDSFTSDICLLLSVIGSEPLPFTATSTNLNRTSRQSTTWWTKISPTNSTEQGLSKALCTPRGGSSLFPRDWTVFDNKKMHHSQHILINCSIFLRAVATAAHLSTDAKFVERNGGSDLSAFTSISFDIVATTVTRCASLAHDLQTDSDVDTLKENSLDLSSSNALIEVGSAIKKKNDTSMEWLKSPHAVLPSQNDSFFRKTSGDSTPMTAKTVSAKLLVVAENLMCVFYDMVVYSGRVQPGLISGPAAPWRQAVDRSLAVTEQFQPHSFLAQLSRWVRDQLEYFSIN